MSDNNQELEELEQTEEVGEIQDYFDETIQIHHNILSEEDGEEEMRESVAGRLIDDYNHIMDWITFVLNYYDYTSDEKRNILSEIFNRCVSRKNLLLEYTEVEIAA